MALKATNDKYNAESNDMKHYKMAGVISAKSQVVAGTKHHLHVLLRESECNKNTNSVCSLKCNLYKY